ncbi:MAG: GNAT family N-acetyltransferase, partial [Planctomycetota bacterium]
SVAPNPQMVTPLLVDETLNWILSAVDPASLPSLRRDLETLRSHGRLHIVSAETTGSIQCRVGIAIQTEPASDACEPGETKPQACARILFFNQSTCRESSESCGTIESTKLLHALDTAWLDLSQQLAKFCQQASINSVIATPKLPDESIADERNSPTLTSPPSPVGSLEKAGFVHVSRIQQLWRPVIGYPTPSPLEPGQRLSIDRHEEPSDAEFLRRVEKLTEDPTAWLDIAPRQLNHQNHEAIRFRIRCEDQVQAILSLSMHDNTREITFLGVAPEYRRRGLATQLLGHAFSHASESGAESITVATTENNEPARRLYINAGFHLAQRFALMKRVLD